MRSTRTRATLAVALLLALAGCRTTPSPAAGGAPSPSIAVSSAAPSGPAGSPSPGPGVPVPVESGSPASPGDWTLVSARVAFPWGMPGNDRAGTTIDHHVPVPPVPLLVTIGAGDHPADPGERPFNRMTFSFTVATPSYTIQYVPRLVGAGKGDPIPLPGKAVLRISFGPAQAHTDSGSTSVQTGPGPTLGFRAMLGYARAGDFEGQVDFGIGVTSQRPVRAYEATYHSARLNQTRYVVAIDVDAT